MIFFQTFSCVIIVFSSTNTIKRGNSLRHCPRQPRQGRRFHDQVIATSFSSYSNPPSSLTDRVRWPRTLDPICRMLRCWQPWTVVGCCEVNTNTNIKHMKITGCQAYYDEMKACTSFRGRYFCFWSPCFILAVSGSISSMWLGRRKIALSGRRTLLTANFGWTGLTERQRRGWLPGRRFVWYHDRTCLTWVHTTPFRKDLKIK